MSRSPRLRSGRTRVATAVVATTAVVAMAGCGSSDDEQSSAEAATPEASECVETAQAVVDAGRAELELVAPESEVDQAELEGKSLWLVNVVNNQLTTVVADGFTAGAEALGMDTTVIDGQGETNTWIAGIDQAVAQGADGIAILGIDPDLASAPLQKAEDAGIPVVDIFNSNPADPMGTGIVAHVTPDFTRSGELVANWMMADSGCEATAFVLGADVLELQVEMMEAIEATMAEDCPDCSVVRENVDLANLANDLGTKVPNVLRREGDIDYLVPVFDSAVTFALPAAQQAGFEGKVLGHDGVPANLDLVRAGDQALDGAFPPNEWIGWATVDVLANAILGNPFEGYTIPVQLFDETNIGSSNDELFPAYDGYEEAFTTAWGL
ncbi:sugar ABC transporter substrate-binding protein [Rhabdothermincola salaria]|uniref:sugar ABC transporter substrate-binding protein n=1 Tax=Rhabdothermincola salaria TaxID=2903142 RepID=UPI001E5AB980|nr:sugar ABC transporter substrate-binding protein [Rhabdothermincola salaria]MCD9622779.1 sugar ABC transporter substrate-binding protein [Rhabdothermincola salaria]